MSLKPSTAVPGEMPAYRSVWIMPKRWPVASARRLTSAAHSGATALVPPTTWAWPPEKTWYPVTGSALPDTSGTPRPPAAAAAPETAADRATRAGTPALAWKDGRAKWSLTPPPPAPSLAAVSFQTTSELIVPVDGSAMSLVPPQASACGLDAGKSTCDRPSLTASPLPLSPEATHTVMPIAAASAIAASMAERPWAVHESSDWPQLMEIAMGAGVAEAAAEIASTKPWSPLFGAK